jgi:endonuclease/exonuclease/phosphatase family metal-dependent hydrolase
VATYNVRRPMPPLLSPPADRWCRRAPLLASALRRTRPAVLAGQEVVPRSATVIGQALGPGYRRVGAGRGAQGRGEGCPIFFDAERLRLRQWQQLALSDTPAVPGSRGWGNLFPRTLVTATFEDRRTDDVFSVVNTHLDVLSARSRMRSVELIRQLVQADADPTVVTGDMNVDASAPELRSLCRGGLLEDAWTRADERLTPSWRTFGGYRSPREGKGVDWIFVTSGLDVRAVAIEGRAESGGWPSDHLPMYAVIEVAR